VSNTIAFIMLFYAMASLTYIRNKSYIVVRMQLDHPAKCTLDTHEVRPSCFILFNAIGLHEGDVMVVNREGKERPTS